MVIQLKHTDKILFCVLHVAICSHKTLLNPFLNEETKVQWDWEMRPPPSWWGVSPAFRPGRLAPVCMLAVPPRRLLSCACCAMLSASCEVSNEEECGWNVVLSLWEERSLSSKPSIDAVKSYRACTSLGFHCDRHLTTEVTFSRPITLRGSRGS